MDRKEKFKGNRWFPLYFWFGWSGFLVSLSGNELNLENGENFTSVFLKINSLFLSPWLSTILSPRKTQEDGVRILSLFSFVGSIPFPRLPHFSVISAMVLFYGNFSTKFAFKSILCVENENNRKTYWKLCNETFPLL